MKSRKSFQKHHKNDNILLETTERIYDSPYNIQISLFQIRKIIFLLQSAVGGMLSRDRLVDRTMRYGRSNPGSNPGPGISFLNSFHFYFANL